MSSTDAIEKNIISAMESTIVVISGLAIIAGSSFNFFAQSGKMPPNILATRIVAISVSVTVRATPKSLFDIK